MEEPQTTEVSTPQQCNIKTQFLNLQERMKREFQKSLKETSAAQRILLNRAEVLSEGILKAHDEIAGCECFTESFIEASSQTSNRKEILQHLGVLKKLLETLESEKNGQKSNGEIGAPNSVLNPFSDSFVPKNFLLVKESICTPTGEGDDSLINNYKKPIGKPLMPCNKPENSCADVSSEAFWDVSSLSESYSNKDASVADQPPLLNCFYGLQRYKIADHPTLRFPRRPAKFTSIWSVSPDDRKLWNPRAVSSPCGCPPAFGYSLPQGFFGDFSQRSCVEPDAHLSFYPECDDIFMPDDELDVATDPRIQPPPLEPLTDPFPEGENWSKHSGNTEETAEEDREKRMEGYKIAFTQFVSEICSLTEEIEKREEVDPEETNASDEGISLDAEFLGKVEINAVKSKRSGLDKSYIAKLLCSSMTKGLIYDSSFWNFSSGDTFFGLKTTSVVNTTAKLACDPPCSVWCDSKAAKSINPSGALDRRKNGILVKSSFSEKGQDQRSKTFDSSWQPVKNELENLKLQASNVLGKLIAEPCAVKSDLNAEARSWVPNPNRYRHCSGDSGYSSDLGMSIRKARASASTYLHSCGKDFASSPYDNNLWTPLPECTTGSEQTEVQVTQKPASMQPGFDRRFSRPNKIRTKKILTRTNTAYKELSGKNGKSFTANNAGHDFPALNGTTKVK